jgi:hypothetical protein
VDRETARSLMRLPGVGKSIAKDLYDLGFRRAEDLAGADPEAMYARLQQLAGRHLDRCLLYTFRCAVYAASTPAPEPDKLKWWNWKDGRVRP